MMEAHSNTYQEAPFFSLFQSEQQFFKYNYVQENRKNKSI